MTVVDGTDALAACLAVLEPQGAEVELEIIVPWDDSLPEVADLTTRFVGVRFIEVGKISTAAPIDGDAGRHELFDRRRALGLGAATGEVVAMLEDRGLPRRDWARRIMEAHELPHAVIGGAVENGRDTILSSAVFLCDFSRYQLPFAEGPANWVTDVNLSYKRQALEKTRELWTDRFHEPEVHGALSRSGETLWLSPRIIVDQRRKPLPLSALLSERFHWGRHFAAIRVRELTTGSRLVHLLGSPLLPCLLFCRKMLDCVRKPGRIGAFLLAAPALFLLLSFWSLGEGLGYLKGPGRRHALRD